MPSFTVLPIVARSASLLAIQLLFLVVWGFAGISKIKTGYPAWFPDKFGSTFLATFPGLKPTFWILTASELLAFALTLLSLLTAEFLPQRSPRILLLMLAWGLFIFVQLSLGQWLTSDFGSAAQLFTYFAGTLLALMYVERNQKSPSEPAPDSPAR